MRIHLTGSSSHLDADLTYLRAIVKAVHEAGGSIVHNWVEMAYYRSKSKNGYDNSEWSDIVSNNIDAISRADALIIEGSNYGFFQGFQASFAMQRRCPVLFLSRHDYGDRAISGISSPLLTVKTYETEAEVAQIIANFFTLNVSRNIELEIDERNYTFLRGEALLSGKSESDIVNDLIKEKLEK